MKTRILILELAFVVLFVMAGHNMARATIDLTEDGTLTLTGFVRTELCAHIASRNPNNNYDDNNDFNLFRNFFQTEVSYKPTTNFEIFTKLRFTGDQTADIDSEVDDYNAFPVSVPSSNWTLMKTDEDDFRAEIWELYADLRIQDLWLRMGKQQIVWGEMISSRIMDLINPLDLSWNFMFEPEEYENIRIPNWSIRGSYLMRLPFRWIKDVTIEGFLNPGDILPTQNAEPGAPFNLIPQLPPFLRFTEKDRRGDIEYGLRIGGFINDLFYVTLNYLHLYTDSGYSVFRGLTPDSTFGVPFLADTGDFTPYAQLLDTRYPSIDVYGLNFNYAFAPPLDTVVSVEATWTPEQPYGDAGSNFSNIVDQGTFNSAIRFDRKTFVFPDSSAMMVQLQFNYTLREGDEDDLLGTGGSKVDKSDSTVALILSQPFWHDDIKVGFNVIYNTDGASYIKPSFMFNRGDHWYFDVW
ncbi:MAG: DUF1302 family protein, partial [Thermodesulfobacteriota bacterium]|nr:DUF1302 family protein [Thermodesulfobacteriota bacterium]